MAEVSHPDKVLFPEDGITKGEVAEYYEAVAPLMLPHIRARPLTMERFPSGIGQGGFLQKNVAKGFPAWLERIEVPKKGGTVNYPLVMDERSLLWVANQNTVTLHVWTSRVPELWQPDILVVDLDPSREEPDVLRAAALQVRDFFLELNRSTWVKTSGSKGYHIVLPLDGKAGYEQISEFALSVARQLVTRDPDHLTLEFNKVDRGDRIYVDVGRNGPSATFAAAYSLRPKSGAPVSAPVTWDELERGIVEPQTFNLRSMSRRIARVGDLWKDMYKRRPSPLPRIAG